jgi:hypothetical protein
MRRIEIRELHESAWFPQALRDLMTDSLQFILNAAQFYKPIAEPLAQAVNAAGATRVVDLCSGGAGPWLWLHAPVRAHASGPLEIVLTDKYPNLAAFEHAEDVSCGAVSYSAEPVEAARIPPQLSGFRTLFSAFHHFSPAELVAMLQDATDQRQGFGAFEGAHRRATTMFGIILVPLAAFISAPFVRPFRWSRLFWSWLLPAVPLVLFVDGIISCLRAYKPAEMLGLCRFVKAPQYVWNAGEAPGRLGSVAYLLGYPADVIAKRKPVETNVSSIQQVSGPPRFDPSALSEVSRIP